MELDFDPKTLTIVGILIVICLLLIWKTSFMDNILSTPRKIMVSILSIPIVYFITVFQINKD